MQSMDTAPMRNQSMNADAPDSSADTGADSDSSMVKVCILCKEDGTYSVYTEDPETNEQGQSQDTSSVDEALDVARQMLEQEKGEGDDNAPMSDQQAQQYWNQLAAKRSQPNGY
jgi:hypothetical protein